MKQTLLPALSMLLSGQLLAQLPYSTSAPLAAHMQEVNAQWPVMDPDPTGGATFARYTDEADRIATHLHLVIERLRVRVPEGLAGSQLAKRMHLLGRLTNYADAGRFPQNHVVAYRNPIFIDPHGTACAVGWLMIESGHRSLAESISAEMNLGYLHAIAADARFAEPVSAWAQEHGFTADELAWIQPGYPLAVPTFPIGGGTNGTVTVMRPLQDGSLLLAGAFTQAGTTGAQRVARWDGGQYHALGSGPDGEPSSAAEHDGMLYVGGSFQGQTRDLAVWNGSSWSYHNVSPGMAPRVNALHVHNGDLYAACLSQGFAGTDHSVRKLVDGIWNAVGDPFNDTVMVMATHQGDLVAAGAFTQPVSEIDPLMMHVARFDGDGWLELANGLDATVRSLLDKDGTLYAAGDLYRDGNPVFGMARLIGNAPDWEEMMPGKTAYLPMNTGAERINALAPLLGGIAFGGSFFMDDGNIIGNYGANLGWMSFTPDDFRVGAWHNDEVQTMAHHQDLLHYGGAFTSVTGANEPVPYAAYTTYITDVVGQDVDKTPVKAWPLPARDLLHIDLGTADNSVSFWRCHDAAGRQVDLQSTRLENRITFQITDLSPGAYLLLLQQDKLTRTVRFVKE